MCHKGRIDRVKELVLYTPYKVMESYGKHHKRSGKSWKTIRDVLYEPWIIILKCNFVTIKNGCVMCKCSSFSALTLFGDRKDILTVE